MGVKVARASPPDPQPSLGFLHGLWNVLDGSFVRLTFHFNEFEVLVNWLASKPQAAHLNWFATGFPAFAPALHHKLRKSDPLVLIPVVEWGSWHADVRISRTGQVNSRILAHFRHVQASCWHMSAIFIRQSSSSSAHISSSAIWYFLIPLALS